MGMYFKWVMGFFPKLGTAYFPSLENHVIIVFLLLHVDLCDRKKNPQICISNEQHKFYFLPAYLGEGTKQSNILKNVLDYRAGKRCQSVRMLSVRKHRHGVEKTLVHAVGLETTIICSLG